MNALKIRIVTLAFLLVLTLLLAACTESPMVEADSVAANNVTFRDGSGNVILNGAHIKNIDPTKSDSENYAVLFTFTDEGADVLSTATANMIGETMSLYIHEELAFSAPIEIILSDGKMLLGGTYTKEEAEKMTGRIKAGFETDVRDPISSDIPPTSTAPLTPEPPNDTSHETELEDDYKVIQFGRYDWRVLDEQDGQMLIISDKTIERRPYHNEQVDITWADCDLRAYLNGDFYNSFSAEDKERIISVTNRNLDNQWYGTKAGEETIDYIFVLSLEEVVKYFGDSGKLLNRPDAGGAFQIIDQYSEGRIAYNQQGDRAAWWLRSPGKNNGRVVRVNDGSGDIYVAGDFVDGFYGIDVRPSMWISAD